MGQFKTIKLDEVEYVRKDDVDAAKMAEAHDDKEYCIVRTYSAGVFAGYIDRNGIDGQRGTIYNARRLWYWSGASSLSQLAADGVKNPSNCKFPCEVAEIDLLQIVEITPATQKAKDSIAEVDVWKQ